MWPRHLVLAIFSLVILTTGNGFLVEDKPTVNTSPGNESEQLNATVCFDLLGCFSNIPPYDNAANLLPLSPDYLNTTFELFTSPSSKGEEIRYDPGFNARSSSFNPTKVTKIVAHGFTQNASIYWMQNMKKGFLSLDNMNVILVDWGNGAAFPNYPLTVANARLVGTQLFHVIKRLVAAGASLSDLHCIGHSLGAHVCGHAGMLLGGKMGRISGLDAAGPEYEGLGPQVRLDASDAMFVDAMHTNCAPIFIGGLGIKQHVGHIDFYVNGGETQPGCPSITSALGTLINGVQHGEIHDGKRALSCSHSRSHELFVESITSSCPFTAYPCNSIEDFEAGKCSDCRGTGCPKLGYHANESKARGNVYIDTTSAPPFCGYHYFVKLNTNGTDTRGQVLVRLTGSKAQSPWMQATRGSDDSLGRDSVVTRTMVSSVDVGDIQLVNVRYVQSHGFWFLGGKETWEWSNIEITPSNSPNRFYACTEGAALKDGEDGEFLATTSCQ